MNIKDYLPYYIGQRCIRSSHWEPQNEPYELTVANLSEAIEFGDRPLLRRLSDMTEREMMGLLLTMTPDNMDDKPKPDEYDFQLFRNDGGNLVDKNVEIGAEYSCRCYEGKITIKKCGTICAYDESGDEQELVNAPQTFHYLLKQGFDLWGLIEAGAAIDSNTINKEKK